MKDKKLNFFIVAFILLFSAVSDANAQSSITVEASQSITNFIFVNSEGTQEASYFILDSENEYKPVYSGAYHFGYMYTLEMGMFFSVDIGMRKAGATMVYDAANYQWDLRYIQGRIGMGYVFDLGMVNPYLSVTGYYSNLLQANQRINNEDFDIMNNGSIETSDYGVYVSPGARIDASEFMSVYLEISYLMGLQNIEAGNTGQEAFNVANPFTLGLSFTIQ